ncbi:HAD family hydrolase [Salibacterium salarium]|nr:HAD hydrolase-like protein [Salibacterium salarium]
MKVKVLIFDMDGTLFDSRQLLSQAIENTLQYAVEQKMYDDEGWTEKDRVGVIGQPYHQAFRELLPQASEQVINDLEPVLDRFILREVNNGKGGLFPGVKETLSDLSVQGYELYVASNGNAEYVPAALEREGLTSLFKGVFSVQQYQAGNKVELVRTILQKAGKDAIMIGDRSSDIEAGKENQLVTIGCRFGYGDDKELAGSDKAVDHFKELTQVLTEG